MGPPRLHQWHKLANTYTKNFLDLLRELESMDPPCACQWTPPFERRNMARAIDTGEGWYAPEYALPPFLDTEIDDFGRGMPSNPSQHALSFSVPCFAWVRHVRGYHDAVIEPLGPGKLSVSSALPPPPISKADSKKATASPPSSLYPKESILLPSAGHLEERPTVSQSISRSGKQPVRQSIGQAGKQT